MPNAKIHIGKIIIDICWASSFQNTIKQTWPKCGPPTYFCGPWAFFWFEKKQHIDLLLSEIWSKAVNKSIIKTKFFLHRSNCNFIITYFQYYGPWWKIVFKFGPRSKKSGHPFHITIIFHWHWSHRF